MADRPLSIAFLGCGRIAGRHAGLLRRMPGVRTWFASRDPARAEAFRARHGGSGSFPSYEAALADPTIDAALVLTPPDSHHHLAVQALESGKDVIVEKPAFLGTTEADHVAAVASRTGHQVLVAENYHYRPLLRVVRERIAGGAIGDLRLVQIDAVKAQRDPPWLDRPGMRGALWEGGIHWLHFLAMLGPELRAIGGLVAGDPARERTTLVTAEFAGGAVGSLAYSWEVPSPLKGIRMSHCYGTAGVLAFETQGLFVRINGRRTRLLFPGFRDIGGTRAMWTDFVAALRGERAPSMTLALARRDLALVEACHRPVEAPAPMEES